LRVILGENNAQKVTLEHGVPCSLAELLNEIQTQCNLMGEIRLQIMDPDFHEFVNLTSTTDVQNKSTLKVIKLCESLAVSPSPSSCDTVILSSRSSSELSPTSSLEPQDSTSNTKSSWPTSFVVPRFSYDAEIKLEQGNSEYKKNGFLLNPDPKLKSAILNGLAEEVVKFKVYLSDAEFNEVAEALIKQHPCLKERGSLTGCSGWKRSLKYKMSNYRTKLRNLGCSEVTINSMKHKPTGISNPAFGVKKPRKAEVNFCPSFLPGETPDSMEQVRVSLLSEVKKKNNEQTVRRLMDISFALRRQE
ncbi:sterile alpha motif domain-containing protein 3-like, partial [Silurus asotus]